MEVIYSAPITEIEIEISPWYADVCRTWLEQQGCQVTPMTEWRYLVSFPEGTREETRVNHTAYRRRQTYVILPSRREMPLYAIHSCNPLCAPLMLGFPTEIFT